jgi:hypothetical protein
MLLEARGVPTIVLATDEFVELAHLESGNRGVPGLPLAVVKHPLGGISEAEALLKVDTALAAVVRELLVPAEASQGGLS